MYLDEVDALDDVETDDDVDTELDIDTLHVRIIITKRFAWIFHRVSIFVV